MTRTEFAAAFAASPLERPGYGGLRRNAAIVLGNLRDPAALPELLMALNDEEPLVRGAAAWAVATIGDRTCTKQLLVSLEHEQDSTVREELRLAIDRLLKSATGSSG
jgi:epoxyqueuosine reductase